METIVTSGDYCASITVPASSKTVFDSLTTRIPEWWTTNFDGLSQQNGDVFTVRFGSTYKKMKLEGMVTDKKVVWHCVDAHIDIPGIQNSHEWTGTRIVWEIEEEKGGTNVTLTHIGLTSRFECYEQCEKGWTFFVKESLYQFLTGNKGLPFAG